MQEFKDDITDVIDRAYAGGVNKFLVPGIDAETSQHAVNLNKNYPGSLYAAVGIHPNSLIANLSLETYRIKTLSGLSNVYAIGEIGLDFYREFVPADKQIEIFKIMLEISNFVCKPICIHNRDADIEIIDNLQAWYEILEKNQSKLISKPGVFHSFNGSKQVMEWGLSHHFYFGISGPVTFPKSIELRKAIKKIDIHHLLLETDSPYLSPSPYRGKRNEPFNVSVIAEKIAEIKDLPLEEVIRITSNNASKLFGWN